MGHFFSKARSPEGEDEDELIVQRSGEVAYLEKHTKTYLDEPFTKEKPLETKYPEKLQQDEHPLTLVVGVRKINHYAIEANNVDLVANFYIKILGFSVLPRPNLGFRGYWPEMPHVMLHIIESDPSVPRNVKKWTDIYTGGLIEPWFIRRACHMAFEVDDFDKTESIIRSHGIEYSRHVLPETNMKQLFMFDPEGHGIELGVYDDSREFIKSHGGVPPE